MNLLEKYAELLVKTGINIQKKQTLVISTPVQAAEFARLCGKKAYQAGAKEVVFRWVDELSNRLFYDYAADEVFDQADEWQLLFKNHYANIDAAFLSIYSDDPEIMAGVDPSKISRHSKAYSEGLKPWRSRLMSNKNAWCVACLPSAPWAKKVFPNSKQQEAIDQLWDAIFTACRVKEADPVAAWAQHQTQLDIKLNILNSTQFKAFKYKNSLGTDLIVEMPDYHIWYGGADTHTLYGYKFVANMPTEEIYSMPKYNGVNGKLFSAYPLNYNGVLIEDIWFEFKEGVVINYGASTYLDHLTRLLETDEGAKRLGEIALVPYNSPISDTGILFYNTLFDENASCHFALGEAYPICIKGGDTMDEKTLLANGANVSSVHVDFMVGTKDLEIVGITKEGMEIQIFYQGNFAI